MRKKVLVILGPTATGKSALAIRLAKKFNGEVVSADSRQVYTGMNIGTGKVTKRETRGVAHHLLNAISPKKVFTVADWRRLAVAAIEGIGRKGKLPIICGGTGLYIQSVVDSPTIPDVPPNLKLRRYLGTKLPSELFQKLKKLDPRRAGNIDAKNRVRLVRAIEIAMALGAVPKLNFQKSEDCEFLQIGLKLKTEDLRGKIKNRLLKRLKAGMVAEVKRLRSSGVSWRRLDDLGLEYRFVAKYLRGELTRPEMIEKLLVAINQYAKRQMTWFKRDKRIHWFEPDQRLNIENSVADFL